MLAKPDFTAEEWNVIRRAPFTAGLVVVATDVKLHGAPSGLVKAVVADLDTAEGRRSSSQAAC